MKPVFLAILVLAGLPCPAVAIGERYEVREVKPHIFVWIPEDIVDVEGDPDYSRAGTAGFIVTSQGVVVIDATNSPFHGRELLYEINHRTDAPIKYVIDTDGDAAHVLGNEVFVDEQATILSTPEVVAAMRDYQTQLARRLNGDFRLQARMRGIHLTEPGQTFSGEMRLELGGVEIRLVSLSTGERVTDVAVYLPQSRVLFLGDLFGNQFFPHFGSGAETRDVRRWTDVLRQVESWDVEVYVPGQGAPGDKKDVAQFRQFLEWLANEVGTRIKEGKSLQQTERELLRFPSYPWHAPELAAPAIEAVYEQLAPAPQPAPPAATSAPDAKPGGDQ